MSEHVTAYRKDTGEPVEVPATWVDHPGIFGGVYVSEAPKTTRTKREPVETAPVAATATSEPAPATGAVTTTKE